MRSGSAKLALGKSHANTNRTAASGWDEIPRMPSVSRVLEIRIRQKCQHPTATSLHVSCHREIMRRTPAGV
ncbi:hypothetical protein J4228_01070 [Candidatus Woesearchaeota archaeon]|nr:hypothetical protein [Candidatus Woesearchaeota archaeon]